MIRRIAFILVAGFMVGAGLSIAEKPTYVIGEQEYVPPKGAARAPSVGLTYGSSSAATSFTITSASSSAGGSIICTNNSGGVVYTTVSQ